MSGYTQFGYTQLKDSDFDGRTKEQLEERFSYLPAKVVGMIVKKYASKVQKKPKKKTDENA